MAGVGAGALPGIAVEVGDEPIEFLLGRTPVALIAFSDETQTLEGDPRMVDGLDLDRQAVNSSGAEFMLEYPRGGILERPGARPTFAMSWR